MIESLSIQFFQAWEHGTLAFHPGVNVVTGDSDVGKTSLFRMMELVLENRPNGEAYRSHFAGSKDSVKGMIEFDDGWIERERKGNTINLYRTSEGEEMKALRGQVPTEVRDITRMGVVNIQRQHDPYFMLNDTAGQVAKQFNNIIGLGIMDKVLAEANSAKRKTNQRIAFLREESSTVQEQIKELDWLEDAEKLIAEVELLETQCQEKADRRFQLCTETETLEDINEKLETFSGLPIAEKLVAEALDLVAHRDKASEKIMDISQIITTIEEGETDRKEVEHLLSHESLVNELLELYATLKTQKRTLAELTTDVSGAEEIESKLDYAIKQVKIFSKKKIDALKELPICPTCERPL